MNLESHVESPIPPPEGESQKKQQSSEQSQKSNVQGVFGDFSQSYSEENFEWKIGDVDEDLMNLEYAINSDNAEENLMHVERLETMDTFAAQRRLLIPDMHKFITRTLRWSFVFVMLKRVLLKSNSPSQLATLMGTRLITLPWDIHFWTMVVTAPILFLIVKRQVMAPPAPIPYELWGLPLEYLDSSPTVDWKNPKTTCQDYILCLAEQWASAVSGMALLGAFQVLCRGFLQLKTPSSLQIFHRINAVPIISPPVMAAAQFVTRLGAMVSVYQFPRLLFELQRPKQPRPVKRGVAILQPLIGSMFRWGMPLGLASDLSQALAPLTRRGIVAFYGMSVAFLSAMEIRYRSSRIPSPPTPEQEKRRELRSRMINSLPSLVGSMAAMAIMCAVSAYVTVVGVFHKRVVLPKIWWLNIVTNAILLLSVIGPLFHLAAFQKIFNIVRMHDLSLTTEPEIMQEILNNPQERQKRYQWRHRLLWREPERVGAIIGSRCSKFWYWFFLSGSVEEKFEKMDREQIEAEQKRLLAETNVWARVKRDMEYTPPETPPNDRESWKKNAMEVIAGIHKDDLQKNEKLGDPLGVLVQMTFGVSLIFMDSGEHMKPSEEGEKRTTRRLQARAAKSAVAKVKGLMNEDDQKIEQIRKEIKDSKVIEEKIEEIRQPTRNEINRLAKRLYELTPYNHGEYYNGTKFQFFGPLRSNVDVGGRIMTTNFPSKQDPAYAGMYEDFGPVQSSPSLKTLLGTSYDMFPLPANLTTPSGVGNETSPTMDDGNDDKSNTTKLDSDDEYAYLKQRFGGRIIEEENPDDDSGDDDMEDMGTILV